MLVLVLVPNVPVKNDGTDATVMVGPAVLAAKAGLPYSKNTANKRAKMACAIPSAFLRLLFLSVFPEPVMM